jgi:hypothetical protein
MHRIIAFSDGVVAIAITLLILPLTEIDRPTSATLTEVVVDNWTALFAFALSFAVIANKLAIQRPGCKINDGLKGTRLLKQMSGSRDYFNGDGGPHHSGRTLVELADLRIPLTDDEERRRQHPSERVASQIGPATP